MCSSRKSSTGMDKKARNGQLAFRLLHKYHNINIIVLILQKIRDTKGIFYEKMGTIKDRNGTDLQKQKTLRRGGKNTQNNYTKKIFMTQITVMV